MPSGDEKSERRISCHSESEMVGEAEYTARSTMTVDSGGEHAGAYESRVSRRDWGLRRSHLGTRTTWSSSIRSVPHSSNKSRNKHAHLGPRSTSFNPPFIGIMCAVDSPLISLPRPHHRRLALLSRPAPCECLNLRLSFASLLVTHRNQSLLCGHFKRPQDRGVFIAWWSGC